MILGPKYLKIQTILQTLKSPCQLIQSLCFNFVLAFITHGTTQIALLFWKPHPDHYVRFYIFAALWAIGDAVMQSQLNGKL